MILHTQMDTVDLGYQADAPITLSGKKYALNKVYVLNKVYMLNKMYVLNKVYMLNKVYVLNKQTGNGVPLKQDKYSFTCTY